MLSDPGRQLILAFKELLEFWNMYYFLVKVDRMSVWKI